MALKITKEEWNALYDDYIDRAVDPDEKLVIGFRYIVLSMMCMIRARHAVGLIKQARMSKDHVVGGVGQELAGFYMNVSMDQLRKAIKTITTIVKDFETPTDDDVGDDEPQSDTGREPDHQEREEDYTVPGMRQCGDDMPPMSGALERPQMDSIASPEPDDADGAQRAASTGGTAASTADPDCAIGGDGTSTGSVEQPDQPQAAEDDTVVWDMES